MADPNAYQQIGEGFPGLAVGSIYDNRVEGTWAAKNIIPFGVPVFGYEGDDENCYLIHEDTDTMVFSADFVDLNVITITVNGTDVATTRLTDQATTMALLITNLEAAITGLEVTRTDIAGDDRTLALFLKGAAIVSSAVVTLGVSQPTAVVTSSTAQVFLGVSQYVAKYVGDDNVGQYTVDDMVNVLSEGRIWVNSSLAVNANTNAYVIQATGATQGLFTNVSTDNYNVGCKFRETNAAAGLTMVEVRGQV